MPHPCMDSREMMRRGEDQGCPARRLCGWSYGLLSCSDRNNITSIGYQQELLRSPALLLFQPLRQFDVSLRISSERPKRSLICLRQRTASCAALTPRSVRSESRTTSLRTAVSLPAFLLVVF